MLKKILIIILGFYFLALFESSFLIHFEIFKKFPSLILISVIIWNLLERPERNSGIFGAFSGGFFWDILSTRFFGFHILILILSALFIKFVVRKYIHPVVRLSSIHKKTT